MQALPTFLFAAVLGFYFGGLLGLAIGAGCGWVLCVIAAGVRRKVSRQQTGALTNMVEQLDKMQDALAGLSAEMARAVTIQAAALDAAPVDAYNMLDMRTPRTAEDWEVAYRDKWKLIRRRLVVAHGLRAEHVDAAQDCIMDQHASGHPLPKSEEALARFIEAWNASEAWAKNFAKDTTPAAGRAAE